MSCVNKIKNRDTLFGESIRYDIGFDFFFVCMCLVGLRYTFSALMSEFELFVFLNLVDKRALLNKVRN